MEAERLGAVPSTLTNLESPIMSNVRVPTSSVIDRSYSKAEPVAVDTDVPPRRAICIIATVAGDVTVQLSQGGTLPIPVAVGLSVFPFEVTKIISGSTTATATYWNLQ